MSSSLRPESATASLTASSACAASGRSAVRVALEKPTPLTAILQRFSHISLFPLTPTLSPRAGRGRFRHLLGQAPLWQREVVVQLLEDDFDALTDLRFGVLGIEQVAGH